MCDMCTESLGRRHGEVKCGILVFKEEDIPMDFDELVYGVRHPSFDRDKRSKDIDTIVDYFKAHKEELGRCKVVSPDPEAGEGHYRVSCDKGRDYTVFIPEGL